ncbi:MAG: cation transporter [Bacteroidetes bacterium HGW-Bacteroidetes-17]|jgi:Cu(I)/Ag(I) efflux system membrane protein CusA/SilA|nr:MAG: cation transporter [Bacteroidetes bacterium HGW-Bacteroidetes-17]
MLNKLIRFFLENKMVTILILIVFILLGTVYAPFNWHTGILPRDPVPVDAIPDIGDNQQIVATEWMGRSPKDIEDQITYPLTTSLLGIPGVKTIRSTSMFGMSFIYIIFEDNIEFYWSRSRILEKLNSLPSGTLPQEVQPSLGPDATALGQIFWYTLEGRDPQTGKPTGGWDPQELRTIQDYYVKYSLSASNGVSEVATIGGFVKEYQVDIDPNAMKAFGVSVMDIMQAVKKSNLDIGAETVELNKVEYVIRGLGYIKNLDDLKEAVVSVRNNVPVRISDVAKVSFGPAPRRGGLDKDGVEAVGAVVVARYGSNPMEVINNVKKKIEEIAPGLPQKTLPDGTVSKVTVIPFYDRTSLIKETIGTLESALTHEILIAIIVIIFLVLNLRASILISSLLPIAVLMTFIVMKWVGVEANIVALSGIAIAIGVMVDVGIVFVENIIRHLEMPENIDAKGKHLISVIYSATIEVSSAITTALGTTVVSFLPVFAMQAAEGKLFRPLAFTKTFALLASFVLGIIVLPTLANIIFSIKFDKKRIRRIFNTILIAAGILFTVAWGQIPALALVLIGLNNLFETRWPENRKEMTNYINIGITLLVAVWYLSIEWLPLGAANSNVTNYLFVAILIALILGTLLMIVHFYVPILRWALKNKWKFMALPIITILFGILAWQGANRIFGFMPDSVRQTAVWQSIDKAFPGIGKEFMPALDEGSFLLMPTSMPHSGIEMNQEYVELLDKRLSTIPEVELAVGKWGRINSALDPAPVQMFENTINYVSEYILDEDGHRMGFKVDREGSFILKDETTYNADRDGFRKIKPEELIPAKNGDNLRQWRPEIKSPDDIWNEIVKVTNIPGLTSAPKLQPIQTRLVMLSTGMRAPMGLKVYGPDLETIEKAGIELESILKEIPSIQASSVFYDRAVGAPYIEIKLNRKSIARYGMTVQDVQEILQVSVGGMALTSTVEGRERFPVRVRYARELRSSPEEIKKILVPSMTGAQIPLGELVDIGYTRGPQMIRSENTFLNGYVIFDKIAGKAEVDVVEEAQKFLNDKIAAGQLVLDAGVSYAFAGNYEQQIRATKRLSIVIPISLMLVFLLLYFQFKTVTASSIHFSGVFVAFAGGFIMLWLYSQPWFLNFSVSGVDMRHLFQIHPINLSVAVWVGFIALFGIATDDGVIMGTYIHQVFEEKKPSTINEVREAVVIAGKKRVRPAMMTAAVAIIALLPVLSSTGKGADIMVPMAIPTFGGMIIQIMTMFVVPILQCFWREGEVKKNETKALTIEN